MARDGCCGLFSPVGVVTPLIHHGPSFARLPCRLARTRVPETPLTNRWTGTTAQIRILSANSVEPYQRGFAQ